MVVERSHSVGESSRVCHSYVAVMMFSHLSTIAIVSDDVM